MSRGWEDCSSNCHDAAAPADTDTKQRERLCRYLLRPPLSNDDRPRRLPDRQYSVRLKRAWSDGTSEIVLDGLALLGRLAGKHGATAESCLKARRLPAGRQGSRGL